jgi:DNA-binding Lrp family transcriptional regulator
MITAIVLIQAERGQTAAVGQAIARIANVAEVYSVTGEYDLVAIVRVEQYDQMDEVVPQRLAAVPGIAHTHTLMTFQHFKNA